MRVYVNQLPSLLKQKLPKLIFVFGDEVYQQQQVLDQIRAVCRQQGFDERVRFNSEEDFKWQSVIDEAQALSLFSSQKIIEVEMPKAKPGKEGGNYLKQWCELADNPNLLIVWGPKMPADQSKTKWFKALDADSWFVPVYEIERAKLPSWFQQQFRQHNLSVNEQATLLLCDLFEGNLAGASQEISRLALIYPEQEIDLEKIRAAVSDHSRFTIFQLADDLLADHRKKVAQVINRLAGEETEPVLLIWMLQKEIDTLIQLSLPGESFDSQCRKLRIWDNRKPLYRKALQRLSVTTLELIQQGLSDFEYRYKNIGIRQPYFELMHLCALFTGNEQVAQLTRCQIAEPIRV